jgi:hypothetical protein
MSSTPHIWTKYRSTVAGKKWDVYVPHKNRIRKVSYGAAGMSDYTKHKDKSRRDNYRARHCHDNINDPYSPGFWSMWHLWGESSNDSRAFAQAVSRAKKLI